MLTFLKHLAPGACVRQDSGLGEQMHRALGAELCKMTVHRQTLSSCQQVSRAWDCSRTRRVLSCLKVTQTCYALPEVFILCKVAQLIRENA